MRYLMTFSYDGNDFNGYQKQKNLKTVQGVLEKKLTELNKSKVIIQASGRTDKNVHAMCQKAHFDLDNKIPCSNIKRYLNRLLNGSIYVSNVEEVPGKFHARYDCIKKEYRYYINTGSYDVFKRNYIYQYNKNLEIDKMNKASKLFLGTHNFKSFCNDSKERTNFDRTIESITINKINDIIEISIVGNGFLKQMVRNIVGVLIHVGENKLDISKINDIFYKQTRSYNIKSVPGCGLYLWNVWYR
ncbi:MAG: tRNA pseudouridine(38-40) synthase TruA [bacterium]|nr:tRNA pseudouridine(38-40) synthase TruA [bacterium]